MEQVDNISGFLKVYEVSISRPPIFKVNWLEVEHEDDNGMEAAGITCHSNKGRKWIFIITNYYINEEINQIWET